MAGESQATGGNVITHQRAGATGQADEAERRVLPLLLVRVLGWVSEWSRWVCELSRSTPPVVQTFPEDTLRGKVVLELGSGTGLCGIVAGRLGVLPGRCSVAAIPFHPLARRTGVCVRHRLAC